MSNTNGHLCQRNAENKQQNYQHVFHPRCLRSILGISWCDHWSHYKWRSDGTIWTSGTTRHSSDQKKTICWPHSATLSHPDQLVWLWSGLQKMAEGDLEDKEDMARYTERRYGRDVCGLEWSERDCQRSCQMETTRRPMRRLEQQEL